MTKSVYIDGNWTNGDADWFEKFGDDYSREEPSHSQSPEFATACHLQAKAQLRELCEAAKTRLEAEMAEKDKERMQGLENSLQDSLKIKRQEFDEIKVKYDDAATKVTDLERRLNNQTEEVLRLTAELESYEYE